MSETGTDAKLIRMANQIATFFLSQPEEVRVEGVATHINKFWEVRMRRRFFELVAVPDVGFLPLVVEAASRRIAGGITPMRWSSCSGELSRSRAASRKMRLPVSAAGACVSLIQDFRSVGWEAVMRARTAPSRTARASWRPIPPVRRQNSVRRRHRHAG